MIPDKDQVRAALEWWEQADSWKNPHTQNLAAVARAFVDGSLLPAKPDYEAAIKRGRFVTGNIPGVNDADYRSIVDAALAGKQETGREEK